MTELLVTCAALGWLWAAGPAAGARADLADELGRLEGQRVRVSDQGYEIEDIAGEGKPLVGVIERRGEALYLVAPADIKYRLAGPLARPRMAGPGYKVWVLGEVSGAPAHPVLHAQRIGVLAPPAPRHAAQRPGAVLRR